MEQKGKQASAAAVRRPAARRRKKKTNSSELIVKLAAAAVVLVVLSYCWKGGFGLHHPSAKNREEIKATRELLATFEGEESMAFASAESEKLLQTLKENNGVMVEDLAAEKEKVSAMDPASVSTAQIAEWFNDAAIIGDSVSEAAIGYGYMDESFVFAKIGVSMTGIDEFLPAVMAKNPSVLFICLGMNDIEEYQADVDSFIAAYREHVSMARDSLPGTAIYVQAILPADLERCIEPGHEYSDIYNDALYNLCEELGVYFFNPSFILNDHPDMFDADGIHPVGDFYPLWATYMADIAGLSNNAENE